MRASATTGGKRPASAREPARLLLLFVDGLGLAPPGPGNPVSRAVCPALAGFLAEARPLDATLGVPGLPQSATGQTALLTGINAAALMGRHVVGFPNRALAKLIEERNLLLLLRQAGYAAVFANAYYADNIGMVRHARRKSATTVAALSGGGRVRLAEDMLRGMAVCHDITRATLRARGYDGPLIEPETAADHLLGVAMKNDFTMFEHFLADRAGHARCQQTAEAVLADYDRFLARLLEQADETGATLMLTSDHGNIENLSCGAHTLNPVPWAVAGPDRTALLDGPRDLTDVAPLLRNHVAKG